MGVDGERGEGGTGAHEGGGRRWEWDYVEVIEGGYDVSRDRN